MLLQSRLPDNKSLNCLAHKQFDLYRCLIPIMLYVNLLQGRTRSYPHSSGKNTGCLIKFILTGKLLPSTHDEVRGIAEFVQISNYVQILFSSLDNDIMYYLGSVLNKQTVRGSKFDEMSHFFTSTFE